MVVIGGLDQWENIESTGFKVGEWEGFKKFGINTPSWIPM